MLITLIIDLDSPCKDMNTSVLYDRLGDDVNLVSGPTEISDERFEEVSCCLKKKFIMMIQCWAWVISKWVIRKW